MLFSNFFILYYSYLFMTEDMREYVKSNLERGISLEVIKQNLLSRGHSDFDIDEAINEFNGKKFVEFESEPEDEIDLE